MEQIPNTAALMNDSTHGLSLEQSTPQIVLATPIPNALLTAGTPPCGHVELSLAQTKAANALAAGQSLVDAALAAGVNPSTLYRWRKSDPRFIVAMNAWRIEALACARDRMLALTDEASRAAFRLLRKDNPAVVIAILKSLGKLGDSAPGVTDLSEAADTLRQEQHQREEARRARLRTEAGVLRTAAEDTVWRKHANQRLLENTNAQAAEHPESVMRELRRSDQLCIEADGLPTAEDAVSELPATRQLG